MSYNKPQQFFKCIQVIFAGHKNTEDISPHISVHPLFPSQLKDFGTKLRQIKQWKQLNEKYCYGQTHIPIMWEFFLLFLLFYTFFL